MGSYARALLGISSFKLHPGLVVGVTPLVFSSLQMRKLSYRPKRALAQSYTIKKLRNRSEPRIWLEQKAGVSLATCNVPES